MSAPNAQQHRLRAGMVGMGMIFDDTYRPMFEALHAGGLYRRDFGYVDVALTAVATRTGARARAYKAAAAGRIADFTSAEGPDSVSHAIDAGLDFLCVASPDDRHFDAAKQALAAGLHVLIEKPSVLQLQQVDELVALAREHQVLAKIVYHKLCDPDHKKLRTLVEDGELVHVNSGYCSLLEPKSIATGQFAEWIAGRNPGTYVAVHYLKLIDFTFGGRLKTVTCTGQRGIVGPIDGNTWDSTQLRLIYEYADGRDAAFDIHTSWVNPDNFPGYVEQEVQFRFDNGVWNGHSRKRGVELTVEGKTPTLLKTTINTHYNGTFIEPWGERSQRGYGVEALRRFVEEVAYVEFGGGEDERGARLGEMGALRYNDLGADRQVVAAIQAMEAILAHAAAGSPDGMVRIAPEGRLLLHLPGRAESIELYGGAGTGAADSFAAGAAGS
ncbi:MAG: Gfo/Idh/MocA family oxidoreductase [Acidobacteriota bacterium]